MNAPAEERVAMAKKELEQMLRSTRERIASTNAQLALVLAEVLFIPQSL